MFLEIVILCLICLSGSMTEKPEDHSDTRTLQPSRDTVSTAGSPAQSEAMHSDQQLNTTNATLALEMYRKLLKHKRKEQLTAVAKIVEMPTFEKQYKMTALLLEKIALVLENYRGNLSKAGYAPGMPFPDHPDTREALAVTIETTIFCGDIILRFPDHSHDILQRFPQWAETIKISIKFVNSTGILDGTEKKVLHLFAQELGLIEPDADFVNPHRAKYQVKMAQELAQNTESKTKKKKEKKKLPRGPRLSRADL